MNVQHKDVVILNQLTEEWNLAEKNYFETYSEIFCILYFHRFCCYNLVVGVSEPW